MSKNNTTSAGNVQSQSKPCLIVAIGASAGGLEAVSDLLKHLPSDTGMAYFYIQHLDPTHESMLSTILARSTSMKVMQATESAPIVPNHLYIIPPDKNIAVMDGLITLTERKVKPVLNMPVDDFFISLAEAQVNGAIGIVLSGTGTDGTIGLKAIKAAGGLTFVQDSTARFQGMPKSAQAQNVVDMVLSPEHIARELVALSAHADKITAARLKTDEVDEAAEPVLADVKDEDLSEIMELLKKTVRVDFTHYKQTTIKRRILRRMLLHKMETIPEYFLHLKQNPGELNVLYQDMLINVTSFFRDEDTVEYLKKTLIPGIIKNKNAGENVRVWVPACATGEEAYSMAIILTEILGAGNTQVQIFATDLSEQAIVQARLGIFSRNALRNVSAQRLQKYFTKIDGGFRIVKSIRDLCVFAPHNILRDPPFSRLDIISCCNLFIYLDTTLQKKILSIFYNALNSTGYLILGKSESISASGGQLFVQLEKNFRIYSKKYDPGARSQMDHGIYLPLIESQEVPAINLPRQAGGVPGLGKIIDDLLLNKYAPACVVVNQEMEILQFRGSIGIFLEPAPGKASLNLIKMARSSLAVELKAAIHSANRLGSAVKKPGVTIKVNEVLQTVLIEVVPLKSDGEERLFLVVLELSHNDGAKEGKTGYPKDKLVQKLQGELEVVKEDMRSIMEEQQTSNEELQSANEEIISSNEELQSLNEELETAKEEVESANEELMTINMELQMRNEELSESFEYAEALLNTIREAVAVLSADFRVKMANASFYRIFQVKPEETEGRLLFELGNRQWDVLKLRQLLEEVVMQNKQFESFQIEHEFPSIGHKVMLLNARKISHGTPKQDVILLTIYDVTNLVVLPK